MPKQPPIAKADLQKTQGARTPTAVKNNNDVISFINQPSMKEQLAAALPRHMTAERMIRIATTEIRKVPALGDCDTMSFVSAIVQCSQLGLEPGGALGHAYLLPFGNRNEKSGKKNVQLIIGSTLPAVPDRLPAFPRASSAKVTISASSLVWKRSWYTVRVRTKMHQLLMSMPLPALKMAAHSLR